MLPTRVRHFTIHNWPKRNFLRVQRRARPIQKFRIARPLARAQGQSPIECLAAIAADQALTEPVRQRVLQFARECKQLCCGRPPDRTTWPDRRSPRITKQCGTRNALSLERGDLRSTNRGSVRRPATKAFEIHMRVGTESQPTEQAHAKVAQGEKRYISLRGRQRTNSIVPSARAMPRR